MKYFKILVERRKIFSILLSLLLVILGILFIYFGADLMQQGKGISTFLLGICCIVLGCFLPRLIIKNDIKLLTVSRTYTTVRLRNKKRDNDFIILSSVCCVICFLFAIILSDNFELLIAL